MSQRASAKIEQASFTPQCAAAWSGVQPSLSCTFTLNPAWIKSLRKTSEQNSSSSVTQPGSRCEQCAVTYSVAVTSVVKKNAQRGLKQATMTKSQ